MYSINLALGHIHIWQLGKWLEVYLAHIWPSLSRYREAFLDIVSLVFHEVNEGLSNRDSTFHTTDFMVSVWGPTQVEA